MTRRLAVLSAVLVAALGAAAAFARPALTRGLLGTDADPTRANADAAPGQAPGRTADAPSFAAD